MKSTESRPRFEKDIFPAELKEISKRRRKRGLPKLDTSGNPTVDKGLVGLALSGGGIRSTTFGLGVIE